jgi:hypothetical protein
MRKSLVRLGMGVAATAASLALVAPAAQASGGRDVDDGASASDQSPVAGSILDGWANRDLDISAFGSAIAPGISDLMDGWANRDLDLSFGSAPAPGVGDLMDGWANRDMDISAFSRVAGEFVPWAQAHDKFV